MGGETATNAFVKDTLPAGLTYLNGITTSGNWVYPNLLIASLDSGMVDTLTISARVESAGLLVNEAGLISLDQVYTVSDNDKDKAYISVPLITCEGTPITITALAGATNVVWYKDGELTSYGSGNSIQVSQSGTYTFISSTDVCSSTCCCPIIVQTEVCCDVEICVSIEIRKIRN